MTRASPWAPRRLERKTKKLLEDGHRFYDNDGRHGDEPTGSPPKAPDTAAAPRSEPPSG